MAVLDYVDYKGEFRICLPLEAYILPELQHLLMKGNLDVEVARIVLLLTRDATTRDGQSVDAFTLYSDENCYRGQLCSVLSLLEHLDGSQISSAEFKRPMLFNAVREREHSTKAVATPEIGLTDDASADQTTKFECWRNAWKEWSVGFSHFIELMEVPTEVTLWFLLGRRAAGVFPRNHKRADLIIPILRKNTGELTPSNVFDVEEENQIKNELSEYSTFKVIRISMGLRECSANLPPQSYLIDNDKATASDRGNSYLLSLQGICGLETSLTHWPLLLSEKISDQLAHLADSRWWDPWARVQADLARRGKESTAGAMKVELPDDELVEGAACPLRIIPYSGE
ncbi:hypothetical protein PHYSODRAFT_481197 [Phytophthora sojae]|uniref:Uncharacterized protein n=1 Tax=Phytophthora sojae (strain P6497) TaxID=1094619 RepID=G4YU22_PHYSP|nr:hypothetical protein PHYSODRAFT_481197 [Phytophthora sojae]EGZ23100.1 hypothetical protein PHYSODRAFT_481197 [Phytophthora sojae]|eukprot:XP_009518388.1 hypothetical protein PHYSODRAFT_481197 [Phytophthora sojae]